MKQRHVTLSASIVALVLSFFSPSSASSEDVLDCARVLRRITDLDRLPYLEEGVVSKQFSAIQPRLALRPREGRLRVHCPNFRHFELRMNP